MFLITTLTTVRRVSNMKLKKTGLFVPLRDSTTLFDALSPTLERNYNVEVVFTQCPPKKVCEVFFSPISKDAQYNYAMVLLKYSLKILRRTFKRKQKDRRAREKIFKRLLSRLERKTLDDINIFDLKSISDTIIWKAGDRFSSSTSRSCRRSISEEDRLTSKNKLNIKTEKASTRALETNYGIQHISNNPVLKSKLIQTENIEASGSRVGTNASPLNPDNIVTTGLRPVIIDGSNVAFSHGKNVKFSFEGLLICIKYFKKRGHKVIAMLPNFRRWFVYDSLKEWMNDGTITFTPSRKINNRHVVCGDDRFIIQTATNLKGVIVSLDQYRNFLGTDPDYDETIKNRLLMFTWVGDQIIFPEDPLGPNGPTLDEFLKF